MQQPPAFAAFIKARRLELALSLKEAARRTGIQPSRLHDLEQGRSSTTGKPTAPTVENIRRFSKGYQVAEDFLLDLLGRPKLEPATRDERRLVSIFRGLGPGHREAVLVIADKLFQLDHKGG